MKNPFETLETRLSNIESLLIDIKHTPKKSLKEEKDILNIDELTKFTGLSKSTIYKFTMSGNIPHYKQAKHLYFDREEIIKWLKSNRGLNNQDEIKDIEL